MKKQSTDLAGLLLMGARRILVEVYPLHIASCLKLLPEQEIWSYTFRGTYASGLFPG